MSAVETSLRSSALRLFRPLVGCCMVAMAVACSSPELTQKPLPYASQRAVEAPDFLLFQGSVKSEPLSGGSWDLEVRLEQASYVPVPQQYSAQGTAYVLRLRKVTSGPGETREQGSYLLALVIPRSYLPSIKEGSLLRVQYIHKRQTEPALPQIGVRILDEAGHTLFLANSGNAFGDAPLPSGLSIHSNADTAYVTTFLTPSGCRIRKQHFFATVEVGGTQRELSPGEQATVEGTDGSYRVTLVENFSVHSGQSCMEQPGQSFAYLLERITP